MTPSSEKTRVALLCTGVNDHRGGIESFFRECFDGLQGREEIDLTLCKGSGPAAPGEHVMPCLKRNRLPARAIATLIHRSNYTVEQLSAFPFFCRFVRRWKPHVIFYSDANHGFQLFRWRRRIGGGYKLLFSNGAPC